MNAKTIWTFAISAWSASQPIVARALMGLGGAMVIASTPSVLLDDAPIGQRRIAAAVPTVLLERGS
jgi:MFS family permease